MNVYQTSDFAVVLPDGLKDITVHAFALGEEGPSEVGIVVAYDRLRRGEDLDGFVERQLAAIARHMPLTRVLRRAETTLDRQPARVVDCTFYPPEGMVFQRQVLALPRSGDRVVMPSMTCRDKLTPKAEAIFDAFLANFRLRA
jgi:hypothetical protein